MKPKPIHFRVTPLFGAPLRCGVPVCIGFTVLISGLTANAGDILRGSRTGSNIPGTPGAASGIGGATPASTDAARANAQDTLARTTAALAAMRAMQDAARNAAINGANSLGKSPANAALSLPAVPNGLTGGGLQVAPVVATDPTKWSGAQAPTQTLAADGSTEVTVKQTAQQALLNWQTFNVGKTTTLTFDQSAGGENVNQWIAFNKVSDPSGNPTQILGSIKADGQVFIINQNGIIFGGSSQVNARTLAAAALPINDTLIANGLLSNPGQFLFDGLSQGKIGDVIVQAGSRISSPVGADGNGGCVLLVGANVTNAGTLTTPNGQTILAAGLQIGLVAHASADPSIRGLDVYVGAVSDPLSTLAPYAGAVTNSGLVEAPQGNITLAGKDVYQQGILDSVTSVALNGSVRLLANYGAAANPTYDATNSNTGTPFNFNSAGNVLMGVGSLTRILPDYQSTDQTTGTVLALNSQILAQGTNIHLANGAVMLAPSATVSLQAGEWTALASGPAAFVHSTGQIYLDDNTLISLAGTTDAAASVLQNFLSVTLRGSELAVAPLQRAGVLRGDTIVVDTTRTGTYNGQAWVGTPLADVSGYLGLIERNVAQLTTAGGTLDLSAGGSVVIRSGATLDVSGGWTNFSGATVQTSRVWTQGQLVDIANAIPDQVYGGVFTGVFTVSESKWGVTQSFENALAPTGQTYQAGYTSGAAAGAIAISTPAVALDGTLLGTSVAGTRQIRSGASTSQLPAAASLSLNLQAQLLSGSTIYTFSPGHPEVIFGSAAQPPAADFTLNPNGEAPALDAARSGTIYLSPALLSNSGFGNLTLLNEGGNIVLPENVTLNANVGSAISLTAANIQVSGKVMAPGGSLAFTALNLTSYQTASIASDAPTPAVNPGRGVLTLGPHAILSTAGAITDDRAVPGTALAPLALAGGSVNLAAYTVDLQAGGLIDVSGGYLLSSLGKGTFGNGGVINIAGGKDPGQHTVLGGTLTMDATVWGFSGAKGGTLGLMAPRIQIGGTSGEAGTLLLQPEFFSQGGFGNFKLTGLGVGASPGVLVTAGTSIEPLVESFSAVNAPVGSDLALLQVIQNLPSVRPPVNLTLTSPGLRDLTTVETGDVVVADGTRIITDPGGTVGLSGGTVSILGTILAPGGSISVAGGSTSEFGTGLAAPEVTTYLGPNALLSASGATVLAPDPYGRRTGKVWAGGTISLAGNMFRLPSLSLVGMDSALGNSQQTSAAIYSMAGGDVSLYAGENIEHLTLTGGQWVADSQLQMPSNWLYRRGDVDAVSGAFGINRWGEAASTTWCVDFSNFFQGVGALGGGNVTMVAGHNISNVDAVVPTNARMPGYTDASQTSVAMPDASKLLELGGGDLTVRAGNNIDAGVYYVERGGGTLTAGGSIVTNPTRSVLTQSNVNSGQETAYTELPTTLFVGKGGFAVSARGSVLLGPVANPFLLPGGLLNSFWQKSYFSTYSGQAYVEVSSLGGDVTLRSAATLPGQTTGAATSLLQSWYTNKLELSALSAAYTKPWLRLDETSTAPFQGLFALRPGTLLATSWSGNINVVGDITLAPSPQGTLELLAGGSINGFQPNGVVTLAGVKTLTWGASTINVSDADPAAVPGIGNPFGYQQIAGITNSASLTGSPDFLDFLNRHFAESGGRLGNVLQTEQALHAAGLLHFNDPGPLRLYADGGDISGLTLFSPKQTRILASQNISDIALYIQNNQAGDISVVASGLDLTPYQAASMLVSTDVATPQGASLLEEIAPGVVFANQSAEEQARLAIEVFYRILRDSGRAHAATGNYQPAEAAIALLIGTQARDGKILARARNIRSTNGGDISLLIPWGGLELADSAVGNPQSPPGIITESGGNISIFASTDVSIGIGRIFTLRGGNELIWSSLGNIAAGSSSKTIKSASPTRVLIDPQSAAVQTDLSGLATGGGIGVLTTVKGVPPGDVDLVAPRGTVDAGDAGIRVSGNLNIAAYQVLNTANIAVGGSSAGTTGPVTVSVTLASLTSASEAVAASTATPATAAWPAAQVPDPVPDAMQLPSIITVEVVGYGDDPDDSQDSVR